MLYQTYQAQSDMAWPVRAAARMAVPMWHGTGLGKLAPAGTRKLAAACKVLELAQVTHRRPPWGIEHVDCGGQRLPVTEEVALRTPFGTLLRFAKEGAPAQWWRRCRVISRPCCATPCAPCCRTTTCM